MFDKCFIAPGSDELYLTWYYFVLSLVSPQCTEPAHSSSTEFQCTPQAASLASAWVVYAVQTHHLNFQRIAYWSLIISHWFRSAWMAEHLAIWPTTSVLPAAVVLVHGQPPVWCWTFLVRRLHWETEHLPSQDRVSGTAFLLLRHCRRQSSESCWKLICLFKGRVGKKFFNSITLPSSCVFGLLLPPRDFSITSRWCTPSQWMQVDAGAGLSRATGPRFCPD